MLPDDTLVVTERVKAKAWWLDGPERLTPRDKSNRPTVHSFFDFVPFSKIKEREINVIVTTLKDSKFNYQLDPYSGKLFRSHDYCPQTDVWQKFATELFTPPYSEAVVPRVIDQLGFPQKVIVFGDEKYFFDYTTEALNSYRVRIVGGVIEQYCAIYPCDITDKWLSRMIMIAVNPDDPNLKQVRTIGQLKERIDWEEAIAFMQNGDGRAYADKKELPAYRVVGEIDSKKAMLYTLTKGHLFSFDELQAVRNNCFNLYDYIWKSVSFIRTGKQVTKEQLISDFKMEANKKLVELYESHVVKEEVRDTKIQNTVVKSVDLNNFAGFFKHFYSKYGKSFNLCRRFVTHSNLKENTERHWFFVQLSMFMELIKQDFIYKCDKRGWVKNIRKVDGTLNLDPEVEFKNCSTTDLDYAFDAATIIMTNLRKSVTFSHSEYIEYDNGDGGTHELLNSLVFKRGKKLSCDKENFPGREEIRPIIPTDIRWNDFSSDRNSNGKAGNLIK